MDSITSLGGCHVQHPDGYGIVFDSPGDRNRFFMALGVAVWDRSLDQHEANYLAGVMVADAMFAEMAEGASL